MVVLVAISLGAAGASIAAQPATITLQPQALDSAGIYKLRQLAPDLTGSGVTFAVIARSITYSQGHPLNDYRPADNHVCFTDARLGFYDHQQTPAGISPHCTAICSILTGRDPNAFNPILGDFQYQGAAPDARTDIYEFWHFSVNNIYAASPPDANIIVAGIGSQFDDWWTRGIDYLAERYGLTVVAGIGNGCNSCDPVLFPGAGTNVIGVGVIDSVSSTDPAVHLSNFALAHPDHSSAGPTPDGRCKPDIVAPGNCIVADFNDPGNYIPAGSWSSFATPVVAGTAALILQKAQQDPNLALAASQEGGNSVIKAILLNSAQKLPFWRKGLLSKDDDNKVPLDFVQGAGMVNAVTAYNQLIAGRIEPGQGPSAGWDLNKLNEPQTPEAAYSFTIEKPAEKMITATACWNKRYSPLYPFEALPQSDSNLRLELWAIDTNDPNNDYLLDYSDSPVDNVEHIYHRADPNYTNYEIVALYSDIDDSALPDTAQSYALALNVGPLPDTDNILFYDLNADGIVDNTDIDIMLENILKTIESPSEYLLGDINDDASINADDMELLLKHLNQKATWLNTDN